MLKTLLIEDDFMNLAFLEELLIPYQRNIRIVGKAQTTQKAIELIKKHQPDLVFLDIQLPDGDGFKVLRDTTGYDYDVIFTTAYAEYAIKAFEFSAIHYLLKPIDIRALNVAIDRCLDKKQREKSIAQTKFLPNLIESNFQRIAIASQSEVFFLELDDILYMEADRGYTIIYRTDKTSLLASKAIGFYEKLLNQSSFSRIHDKYLVNLKYVMRYIKGKGGQVVLNTNKYLLVSARRKATFIKEQEAYLYNKM